MNIQAPNNLKLYALHGFLGCKSDWNSFDPASFNVDQIIAVDPFQQRSVDSLKAWAASFTSKIDEPKTHQNILMGYSLGGRLALHALVQQPSLWKAAVIISAHPGLTDEEEKKHRLEQDKQWARRFLAEPWGPLLQTWNQQGTLLTSQPLQRKQADYDRITLAYALQCLSLGVQEDLRPAIAALPFPILWLTGEKDEKYTALAKDLVYSHPHSSFQVVPGSGHRVPWDQPHLFQTRVRDWLAKIG